MSRITVPDAFEVTIYRDDPDAGEANVEDTTLGWEDERGPFRNEEQAKAFAERAVALRGWTYWSATIDRGHVVEDKRNGVLQPHFEDEVRDRWYVGPTWFDYEDRS